MTNSERVAANMWTFICKRANSQTGTGQCQGWVSLGTMSICLSLFKSMEQRFKCQDKFLLLLDEKHIPLKCFRIDKLKNVYFPVDSHAFLM